jgi:simple sugar transport system permease protein
MFVAVFGLISAFIPRQFLSLVNLQSMAFQLSEFGILSLGMMVVMLTGGIDLAIVANANLAGIVAASFMMRVLGSAPNANILAVIALTCLVAIAAGTLAGLFNGVLVSVIGIPPILATLGSMKLFEGFATVITRGRPITGFPEQIQFIANGTVGIVPFSILVFLLAAFVMGIVLRKTPFGFTVYMLGANPLAARYSGVNCRAVTIRCYAIAGAMAGIAAVIMMSRFNSIKVGYGNSYQLQAILVVILGGVNPEGGDGDVLGVLFAILTLQCIASGFNILGFTNYMRNVIYGGMLVLVLIVVVMAPRIKTWRQLRASAAAYSSDN